MRATELEARVLRILDQVQSGQRVEDARVELKREFIDPARTARRLAAHANAARGDLVLWIIGVDEGGQIVGTEQKEMASWFPAVKSNFNELAPELVTHVEIPVGQLCVSALLFDTSRAPYLVNNPKGGTIQYEVPWREGTSTRTATRSELLRILAPIQASPAVEVIGGTAKCVAFDTGQGLQFDWSFQIDLYIIPPTDTRLVIPFHKCKLTYQIDGPIPPARARQFVLTPPRMSQLDRDLGPFSYPPGFQADQHTITATVTRNELLLDGPSRVICLAESTTRTPGTDSYAPLNVTIAIGAALASTPVILDITMLPLGSGKSNEVAWALMNAEFYYRHSTLE